MKKVRINKKKISMNNKGSFTIGELLFLILGVITLVILGYYFKDVIANWYNSSTSCPGSCVSSGICSDNYYEHKAGSISCQKENSKAACCVPLIQSGNVAASQGDMKFYWGSSSTPLYDGQQVSFSSVSNKFTGKLVIDLSKIKGKYAYINIKSTSTNEELSYIPITKLDSAKTKMASFMKDPINYNKKNNGLYDGIDETNLNLDSLKQFQLKDKKVTLEFNDLELGRDDKFVITLIIFNGDEHKSDDGNFYYLSRESSDAVKSFIINAEIPSPEITISVDEKTVKSSKTIELSAGESSKTHTIQIKIKNPYTLTTNISIFGKDISFSENVDEIKSFLGEQNYNALQKLLTDLKDPKTAEISTSVNLELKKESYITNIPLEIKIKSESNPGKPNSKTASSTASLLLKNQLTNLYFSGVLPYNSKDYTLRLDLDKKVTLQDWDLYAVETIFDCKGDDKGNLPADNNQVEYVAGKNQHEFFNLVDFSPQKYSGTFNLSDYNGKYLCLKAEISENNIPKTKFLLGTETQTKTSAVKVQIDNIAPELAIDFDLWRYQAKLSCKDKGVPPYSSGCKETPFSYSYVEDPALFISSIVLTASGQAGNVDQKWVGCPLPYDDNKWVTFNKKGSESTLTQVIGRNQVRVLCVRAKDNAGNAVVKSQLVWSPEIVLSALVTAVN